MQAFYNVMTAICLISLGIIVVMMAAILICLFVDAIKGGVKKKKKKEPKPSRNALVFTKDGYLIYCKESNVDFNAYEEVERYKEIF